MPGATRRASTRAVRTALEAGAGTFAALAPPSPGEPSARAEQSTATSRTPAPRRAQPRDAPAPEPSLLRACSYNARQHRAPPAPAQATDALPSVWRLALGLPDGRGDHEGEGISAGPGAPARRLTGSWWGAASPRCAGQEPARARELKADRRPDAGAGR